MVDLSVYTPLVAGFFVIAVLAITAAVAGLVIAARDRRGVAQPVLVLAGHRAVGAEVDQAA